MRVNAEIIAIAYNLRPFPTEHRLFEIVTRNGGTTRAGNPNASIGYHQLFGVTGVTGKSDGPIPVAYSIAITVMCLD